MNDGDLRTVKDTIETLFEIVSDFRDIESRAPELEPDMVPYGDTYVPIGGGIPDEYCAVAEFADSLEEIAKDMRGEFAHALRRLEESK